MGDYQRFYLILRPARGNAGGHVRLEQRDGRVHVSLSLHGVGTGSRLRVLLFAGLGAQDTVIDLGAFESLAGGRGIFSRGGVLIPGRTRLSACHTLAVCLDWPQNQLLLAAPLNHSRPAAPWMVQQAVSRYLAVPAPVSAGESAAEDEPVHLSEPQQEESPSLSSAPAPLPPLPVPLPADPLPQPPVDALMPLFWPDPLRELKLYFDLLLPCSPFDAPGWRFVKAPLPHGGPAPFCYVGVSLQGDRVARAAYALPADDSPKPPCGLEAWNRTAGPDGRIYWVLQQPAH